MRIGEKFTRKGGVFMRVHLPENGGMTTIENTFIDQFMPAASGDFVKIYLYLLRCAQSTQTDITVSRIADALNFTEADVRRAMTYWEKAGRLELNFGPDGTLRDVHVLRENARPDSTDLFAAPEDTSSSPKITEFPSGTARGGKPSAEYAEQLRRLLFVAEQYYNRPLSQTEQDMLAWLLCDLKMDPDVIEYLLEYCISQGHTSSRYMEKVAQGWHSEGIRTVEEARQQSSIRKAEYYTIFHALGIQNHAPTKAEVEFMDCWISRYALPMDVILLACQRTILQIGKAQFSYTEAILNSWYKSGVKTLQDVERLDKEHEEAAKSLAARPSYTRQGKAKPSGKFDNFTASGSDWDEVTRRIMETQEEQSGRRSQES